MKTAPSFIDLVENGTLPRPVILAIEDAITTLEGKRVRVTVQEVKPTRSQHQNAFYFGVVIQAVREWFKDHGYNFDAEETHDWIVRRIWKHTEVTEMPDGEPYERRLTSKNLTTANWEKNIELVRQFGAEHGFIVPYPHETIEEPPKGF